MAEENREVEAEESIDLFGAPTEVDDEPWLLSILGEASVKPRLQRCSIDGWERETLEVLVGYCQRSHLVMRNKDDWRT